MKCGRGQRDAASMNLLGASQMFRHIFSGHLFEHDCISEGRRARAAHRVAPKAKPKSRENSHRCDTTVPKVPQEEAAQSSRRKEDQRKKLGRAFFCSLTRLDDSITTHCQVVKYVRANSFTDLYWLGEVLSRVARSASPVMRGEIVRNVTTYAPRIAALIREGSGDCSLACFFIAMSLLLPHKLHRANRALVAVSKTSPNKLGTS